MAASRYVTELRARHVAGDRWVFIGGAVEPLEDPRAALAREVHEELGVPCDVLEVLDSYGGHELANEYPNGDRVSYVTTAYVCAIRGVPRAFETDELSDIGWFSPSEVGELHRFHWIDRVISDADRGRPGDPVA